MNANNISLFVIFSYSFIHGVLCNGFAFTIEPRRVTVRPGQKISILCRARVPLSRCMFLLPGDVEVDLSAGPKTPATADFRYFGTGLESGQCGITLSSPPPGFAAVACKAWTEKEGWARDAMFLRVTTMPTLQWEVDPYHVVALPGDNVDLVCRSRFALSECRIGLMNEDRWLSLSQGPNSEATSEYRYKGAGLEHGQCGVTFLKVKEELSGEIRCVGISNNRWAGDFTTMVVAKTPDAPDLQIGSVELRDGDTMEASCAVRNGRPAANITWFVDGVETDDGVVDASPDDAWFAYQLTAKVQKLTRTVSWQDNGKELKCVASHVALFDYVNQDTKHIDVKFSPRSLLHPARQINLVAGRSGMITAEFMANPQPILTWTVGNDVIKDDDVEANGRYKAVKAIKKGVGRWEARLQIKDVLADDIRRAYTLEARNQLGSNTYHITLASSSSRPSGGGSHSGFVFQRPAGAATTPAKEPIVNNSPSQDTAAPVRPVLKQPFPETCGQAVQSNQLIVFGNQTAEGTWPWIAALFAKKTRQAGLEFHCGGTLISKQHVITAAHCIQPSKQKSYNQDDLLVFLGKHNLNDWAEPNSQLKKVKSIHVHPNYLPGQAGNGSDVAVLHLAALVSFTRTVRPICLWDREPSLDSVVGAKGTVVGWGRYGEGDNFVSDVPLMANTVIVSQEECLRSNSDFFFLTSSLSLCAGYRDGGGPCNGDSGSGLVLPIQSGGRTRWHLRGIVSLSLLDRNTASCDLTQYVIYTDVAQFSDWVEQFAR